MMYTKRGYVPSWPLEESATEPKEIVIHDTETGAERAVGKFYKGNPGDHTWIVNQALYGN